MIDIFEETKRLLTMRQVLEHYGIRVKGGWALCPFHPDHKPSMRVYKNSYYCFVCGAGGDLIHFVARYLNLRNKDACETLIRDFNLPVPTENKPATFREKIALQRREQARKAEQRWQKWIQRAEDVLDGAHQYYYQTKNSAPPLSDEWCDAIVKLTEVDFLLDELKENPIRFYDESRSAIDELEPIANKRNKRTE